MILHILATLAAFQSTVVHDNATLTVKDVSSALYEPWALGRAGSVGRGAAVARGCGMTGVIVRYYPQGRAALFTRGRNHKLAENCTSRWLKLHEKSFEPLFGAE